jgi:nucleoside-diphosphate-sugar epimerase
MVLITGSNSLLGKAIVEKFSNEGEKIRCYDQYKPEAIPDGVEFIQGDLFTSNRIRQACQGVDTIIHLMDKTIPSKNGRGKMKRINIAGTKNLLTVMKRSKIDRFIFLSSYGVYGITNSFPLKEEHKKKPYTPYGKDKLKAEIACELFAKRNKINLTIIRPSLILAPNVKNSSVLITLYMSMGLGDDNVLHISGDGDTRFQLLSPEDAADAFYNVYKAKEKTYGAVYNIGSDNVPTHMEGIVKIKENKKIDFAVKHISKFKAILYSILFKPSKINYFTRDHFLFIFHTVYLDCDKIKSITGWSPKKDNIDIMSDVIDWYKGKVNSGL